MREPDLRVHARDRTGHTTALECAPQPGGQRLERRDWVVLKHAHAPSRSAMSEIGSHTVFFPDPVPDDWPNLAAARISRAPFSSRYGAQRQLLG